MVLATRTSAPNTSLAVIRPKPRPDSPTASEISVIMLKSELPHEASNPVSKKEARVHHVGRRRDGVAARGARAADGTDAADRCADGPSRERLESTGPYRGIPGRTSQARPDGRPQHTDRHSLDGTWRYAVDGTIREGTRHATTRHHSFEYHAYHDGIAATNAHHPHRFRDRWRSDWQWLRRKLRATWRKRHRFQRFGTDAVRQVGGTAQGGCAACCQGRDIVQPSIGDVCRILAEALPSGRWCLRSGGDCSTRQV